MLDPADILIVVEPEGPEYILYANRVQRDLHDWKYRTESPATYHSTLKVRWIDGDGWTLTYNNQAQTIILKTLKCLERTLYEDRILANQKSMPPGRLRPFEKKIETLSGPEAGTQVHTE